MRKGRDGEQNKTTEKNDGNSGPLTSLPVGLPKVDRLQRRRLCQYLNIFYGGVDRKDFVQIHFYLTMVQGR